MKTLGNFEQTKYTVKNQKRRPLKEIICKTKRISILIHNPIVYDISKLHDKIIHRVSATHFSTMRAEQIIIPWRNAGRWSVSRFVWVAAEQNRYSLVIKWIQTVWQRCRWCDDSSFRWFLLSWLLSTRCSAIWITASDGQRQSATSSSEIRKKRLK